ncbi:MAG: hypothetical protein E7370_02525 [Clostridiales bacterium]|nr:hypothetical protein [Clostridiales bacterium]
MKKGLTLVLCATLAAFSCLAACKQPHEHEYDQSWSHDANNHWHANICDPEDCVEELKIDEAAHVDADQDEACDVCGYDQMHVHGYSDEWTHDANKHWHAADCGHDLKKDEANHNDENEDGVCDVCEYDGMHLHTFEDEWTFDDDNHWHDADCGHDRISEEAPHVDENEDGECDVCDYDEMHRHTFSDEWSVDEDYHWHDATCEHDRESGKGEHVDENEDGVCDVCDYEVEHFHKYANVLSYDEDNHWYAATCGHDLKKDETAHVDANQDGECDVCDYDEMHVHSFSKDWASDANNHWHPNDCEDECGEELKQEEGSHSDLDENGVCDVCDYDGMHRHTFEEEWTADEDHHWHAADCGHDRISGKALHEDKDKDGKCDECEYEIVTLEIETVEDAIETALEKANRVTSGSITESNEFVGVMSTEVVTSYIFYEDYLYMSEEDVGNNLGVTREWWYESANNRVYGFEKEGDILRVLAESTKDNLYGYYFGCEFMGGGVFFYGVEDMISGVYDTVLAANGKVDTKVTVISEDEVVYSFDIVNYASEYDYYYIGTLEFTLGVGGNVETVNIQTSSYYADQYEVTTDEEGGYVVTLNEDAVASWNYSLVIEQNSDVLEYVENPYDPAKVIINTFKLTDAEGNEVSEINARVGDVNRVNVTDILPESADPAFNAFSVTINGQPHSDWSALMFLTSSKQVYIKATMADLGENTIEVSCGDVVKTIIYNVERALPTSINATIDGTTVRDADVYVGKTIEFSAEVNANADPSYTATITSENADKATLTAPTEEGGNYVFTATEVGEYVITITSDVAEGVTTTLTITVKEIPDMSVVLNGEYVYDDSRNATVYSIVFTPAEEGAITGEALITKTVDGVATTANATYVYNVSETALTVTYATGSQLEEVYAINDYFEVVIKFATFDGIMERPSTVEPEVITGTLEIQDNNNGKFTGTYTYTIEDGVVTVYQDGVVNENIQIVITDSGYTAAFVGALAVAQPLVATEGQTDLTGTWNINFLMNGIYSLTFTPDEAEAPAVVNGTLEIQDNNNGKFTGTYTYTIENGVVTVYQDGAVNENIQIAITDSGYTVAFVGGLATAQPLVATAGQTDLTGTWNVNFVMNGIYTLTFTPSAGEDVGETISGTLEIKDNNNGKFSGTYTYTIEGSVITVYQNGAVNENIQIAITDSGYTVAFVGGLASAQPLVATAGQTDLTGTWNVNFIMNGIYTLTFTPDEGGDGPDVPPVEVPELVMGENTVVITDTYIYEADVYTFVAPEAGTYVFTLEGGLGADDNLEDWEELVSFYDNAVGASFTLTLEEGEAVTIYFASTVKGEYSVTITEGGEVTPPDGGGEETVTLDGTYNVNFVMEGMYVLVFDAEAGTLVVTDNNNGAVAGTYGYSVNEDGGIVITLNGEETDVIVISTDIDGNYTFQCAGLARPQPLVKVEEEVAENVLVVGENTVTVNYSDLIEYTLTATVSGTYTFTSEDVVGFEENSMWNPPIFEGTYSVALDEGETFTIYLLATEYGANSGTVTVAVVEGEGGGEVVEPEVLVAVLGENEIVVTEADYEAGGMAYTFIAAEAGNYTFASNDLFVRVMDANGMIIGSGTVQLEAGTYTLNIVTSFLSSAGTYTLNISYEPFATTPVAVLGENEIVVTEDDLAIGGIVYEFVAAEAGNYTFASSNLLVRILDANGVMVGTGTAQLEAGTYTLNVITSFLSSAGTYSFTISVEVASAAGDGSESNPYVIESLDEDLYVEDSNASELTWYTFTAAASGTLTITFDTDDNWCRIYDVADSYNWLASSWLKAEYVAEIVAGATYNVGFGNWNNTAPVTITFVLESSGEVTPPEEGDEKVLALGDNTVTITDTYSWIDEYTFTAVKGGEYTLVLGAGLGVDDNLDDWEPIVGFYDNESGAYAVINVEAGATVTLYFGSVETGEYSVSIEEGNKLPAGEQGNPIALEFGTTEVEVAESQVGDDNYVYFILNVTDAGWYAVNSNFYVSYDYEISYTTVGEQTWMYLEANGEVVIYRSFAEAGSYEVVVSAVEGEVAPSENAGVNEENAVEVDAGATPVYVDYEVCANGLFVKFVASEDGVYSVKLSNSSAKITYNEVEYGAEELSITVSTNEEYLFVINNSVYDYDIWEEVQQSGALVLSIEKLDELTVGSNIVSSAVDYVNVLYVVTVEETGEYTVAIPEDSDGMSIMDATTYAEIVAGAWGWPAAFTGNVTLEAGVVYIWQVYFEYAGEYEITITAADGGEVTPPEGGEDGDEVIENALVVGENTVNVNYSELTEYTLVATVAGTYTFTSEDVVGFAENSMWDPPVFEGTYSVELSAGESFNIYLLAMEYDAVSGTVNVAVAESEGGEVVEPEEIVATLGEAVEVTLAYDEEAGAAVANVALDAAMTAGTYSVAIEVSRANYGATITFMVGTNRISLDASNYFTATFDYNPRFDGLYASLMSASEMTINLTVAVAEAEGGEEGGEVVEMEGSGTESDPYVLEALPETLYVANSNSSNLTWYTFTATVSGTLTITFDTDDNWCRIYDAADSYNWLASDWLKSEYVVEIVEGATYIVGFGNWNNTAPVTITFSI